MLGGTAREINALVAELGAVGVSPLEMKADHVVGGGQRSGESLVQPRARLLRERRVGRIADQRVVEREAVFGCRAQESLPDERSESRNRLCSSGV